MITLNLLPDVKREFIRTQRSRIKVITGAIVLSAAAIGLTILVALWVYGAQGIQKKLLTDSIKRNDEKLQSVKDINKYITLQNQLSSITALHDSKSLYSRLLDYLPVLNSGVKLSGVTVNAETKTIIFDGQTNNYTSLVVFRDTLKSAELHYMDAEGVKQTTLLFVKDKVNIDSSGIGTSTGSKPTVSFKISALYSDEAFMPTTKKPTVVVPSQETTPSAQNAPTFEGEPSGTN